MKQDAIKFQTSRDVEILPKNIKVEIKMKGKPIFAMNGEASLMTLEDKLINLMHALEI